MSDLWGSFFPGHSHEDKPRWSRRGFLTLLVAVPLIRVAPLIAAPQSVTIVPAAVNEFMYTDWFCMEALRVFEGNLKDASYLGKSSILPAIPFPLRSSNRLVARLEKELIP